MAVISLICQTVAIGKVSTCNPNTLTISICMCMKRESRLVKLLIGATCVAIYFTFLAFQACGKHSRMSVTMLGTDKELFDELDRGSFTGVRLFSCVGEI